MVGLQAKWQAYEDDKFEKSLGPDFYHEDIIGREGWAKYYFKGIFPEDVAYLTLDVVNTSGFLVKKFYFKFHKSHQTSLDGRTYVRDTILDERIVRDGFIEELRPFKDKDGKIIYKKEHVKYPSVRLQTFERKSITEEYMANAIIQTMVKYAEKPKIIFLVTPPHMMKYAKLLLILLKQLVDLNFDQSYMTKSDQKPLYKTRFILDELGNLQSEGHGISGFATMLSIGLGQEQQFTLILQTLQQLRDVYGDSVDKIVQGNAQPLTSKVSIPNGWKFMGDIEVGDKVLTPFGNTTKVIGVYPQGKRDVYEIILQDGSRAESCDEHLWEVLKYELHSVKANDQCEGIDGYQKEILTTLDLKNLVDNNKPVVLPKIAPTNYSEKNYAIDPYVLGVILGNGHITKYGGIQVQTEKDFEIFEEVKNRGAYVNCSFRDEKKSIYYISFSGLYKELDRLELIGCSNSNKFIPEEYLYGSINQRLDLLRGLMDTNGYISTNGEMKFISNSEQLAKGVQQLIRSLGGRAPLYESYYAKIQKMKKETPDVYEVQNIRLGNINPFFLKRKRKCWKKRDDYSGQRVVAVNLLCRDEVQCIRVEDERHLYITDDYLPTHNTSNIVFLKSTDDSMIDTLQKMSGTTHKSYINSKSVTKDIEKPLLSVEGKVSYTVTTVEEPVIHYNDMAFIAERNSIVFRAGDSPIWNRNEMILPMSWRLFSNTIEHAGHEYNMQTIPTLSTVRDFDVRKNQPNFRKMFDKRMAQALEAEEAMSSYKEEFGYTDYEIEQLDPSDYSIAIMKLVNIFYRERERERLDREEVERRKAEEGISEYFEENSYEPTDDCYSSKAEDNDEMAIILENAKKEQEKALRRKFADNQLAPGDFVSFADETYDPMNPRAKVDFKYEGQIIEAYLECKSYMWKDTECFVYKNDGSLYGVDGKLYIEKLDSSLSFKAIEEAAKDPDKRVYSEDISSENIEKYGSYKVHEAFLRFLASQESWDFANGYFDKEMATIMRG